MSPTSILGGAGKAEKNLLLRQGTEIKRRPPKTGEGPYTHKRRKQFVERKKELPTASRRKKRERKGFRRTILFRKRRPRKKGDEKRKIDAKKKGKKIKRRTSSFL